MRIMLNHILHLFKSTWTLEFLVICKDKSKQLQEAMLLLFISCPWTLRPNFEIRKVLVSQIVDLELPLVVSHLLSFSHIFSACLDINFSHCFLQMSKETESAGSHYLLMPFLFHKPCFPSLISYMKEDEKRKTCRIAAIPREGTLLQNENKWVYILIPCDVIQSRHDST